MNPEVFDTWLGIAAQIIAIASIVGGLLWKLFLYKINTVGTKATEDINGLGERVKLAETGLSSLNSSVSMLNQKSATGEMDRNNLHQSFGRLEGLVERQTLSADRRAELTTKDNREIVTALARIEAQLNIGKEIKEGFEMMADALKDRR